LVLDTAAHGASHDKDKESDLNNTRPFSLSFYACRAHGVSIHGTKSPRSSVAGAQNYHLRKLSLFAPENDSRTQPPAAAREKSPATTHPRVCLHPCARPPKRLLQSLNVMIHNCSRRFAQQNHTWRPLRPSSIRHNAPTLQHL
jgi:hypothetical protein